MKLVKHVVSIVVFLGVCVTTTAQEITSFTGLWGMEYYQDNKEITKKEVKELFSKNAEIYHNWKKANTKEVVAGIALVAELGCVFWATSELVNDDPFLSGRDRAKNALGPILGGLGSSVLGVIFLNAANKTRKRAILTYNEQFDAKTTFRIEPISSANGLGLALKF